MPPPHRKGRRILLAATVGLASLTLEGCLFTSGNLVAPPPSDAGRDAGRDAGPDAATGDAGQDAGPSADAGTPPDDGGTPPDAP